jgi:ParB-like nuclease domain
MKYELHPACAAWPQMSDKDIEELALDIIEKGQQHPIILYENQILDGRNRYLACEKAGIDPITHIYPGNDPIGFAISMNLKRRHLNESQRAMVAGRLANMKVGGDHSANLLNGQVSVTKAAEMLSVSPRSITDAKVVLNSNKPALIQQVDKGEIKVSAAAKKIKPDPKIAKLKAQLQEVKASAKTIGNDYHMQVAKGVEERFKVLFPQLSEREAELKRAEAWLHKAIDTKTPVFTEDEFKIIRRCLHPDSRLSVSAETLAKAFAIFSRKEERMVLPPKVKVSR